MNINILRYSLFGIAGGQEVDRNFSEIYSIIVLDVVLSFILRNILFNTENWQ